MNARLEIFSLPTAIENSRQFFPLQADIFSEIVIGCPCFKWSGLYPRGLLTGIERALRNKLFFSIHLEVGAGGLLSGGRTYKRMYVFVHKQMGL